MWIFLYLDSKLCMIYM